MLEIINQRYMQFLFEISKGQKSISKLAKKCDMNLSAASLLISRWARQNIIIKERESGPRSKEIIITLTDYGKAQVKLLKEISKNYEQNKKLIQDVAWNNQNIKEVKHAEKN